MGVEEQVGDYVARYRKQGYEDSQIRESLKKSGVDASITSKLMGGAAKPFFKKWWVIALVALLGVFIFLLLAFLVTEQLADSGSDIDAADSLSEDDDDVAETETDLEEEIDEQSESDEECSTDDDCEDDYECEDGFCEGDAPGGYDEVDPASSSSSSSSSSSGSSSSSSSEEAGTEEGEAACEEFYDCKEGEYCSEGECVVTVCNNGEDEDGDGLYDWLGSCYTSDSIFVESCIGQEYEGEEITTRSVCSSYCSDAGYSYARDKGCDSIDDPSEEYSCHDAEDNDGDGYVDYKAFCDINDDGERDYICGCYATVDGVDTFTDYVNCDLDELGLNDYTECFTEVCTPNSDTGYACYGEDGVSVDDYSCAYYAEQNGDSYVWFDADDDCTEKKSENEGLADYLVLSVEQASPNLDTGYAKFDVTVMNYGYGEGESIEVDLEIFVDGASAASNYEYVDLDAYDRETETLRLDLSAYLGEEVEVSYVATIVVTGIEESNDTNNYFEGTDTVDLREECSSGSDCDTGDYCVDEDEGGIGSCDSFCDDNCAFDWTCSDSGDGTGECVECSDDNISTCGGYLCNEESCYTACSTAPPVGCADGYTCDGGSGVCEEDADEAAEGGCEDDGDCDDGYACDTGASVCYGGCSSDDECTSDAACVTDSGDDYEGQCLVCEDSDGGRDVEVGTTVTGVSSNGVSFVSTEETCKSSTEIWERYCYEDGGNTYITAEDLDCTDTDATYSCINGYEGDYCGTEAFAALGEACGNDVECDSGICDSVCVECSEGDTSNCDVGYVCDTSDYTCYGSCSSDGDVSCADGYSCNSESDDSCVADGVLEDGAICTVDEQCASGSCDGLQCASSSGVYNFMVESVGESILTYDTTEVTAASICVINLGPDDYSGDLNLKISSYDTSGTLLTDTTTLNLESVSLNMGDACSDLTGAETLTLAHPGESDGGFVFVAEVDPEGSLADSDTSNNQAEVAVEYDCDNGIDDDQDDSVDETGGCYGDYCSHSGSFAESLCTADGGTWSGGSDGEIDYICGCYDTADEAFASYSGPDTSCTGADEEYQCQVISDGTLSGGLTCGEGEDIEGWYYEADEDCTGGGFAAAPSFGVSGEEGFFSKVLNWLFFWNWE